MRSKRETVVAEWDKNAREVIRVALTEFRGRDLVSLRVWYRKEGKPDQLHAGKNGLNIGVSHLPVLLKALKRAKRLARTMGLLGGGE